VRSRTVSTGTEVVAPRQIVAVDWSGRRSAVGAHLWIACSAWDGAIVLEHGMDRDAAIAHLVGLVEREPSTLIGLDFAFSFPSWFFDHRGVTDVFGMWTHVAEHAERWLVDCPWPFWGRGARLSPTTDAVLYRLTEQGIGAKSAFQLYYPGAVGASSLRGMPHLATLRAAGMHIWPFDTFALPAVVEIYPRRFTGEVTKSSAPARRAYLASRYGPPADVNACASEDAFDAYVSAREMGARLGHGAAFPVISEPQLLLEGLIWDGTARASLA